MFSYTNPSITSNIIPNLFVYHEKLFVVYNLIILVSFIVHILHKMINKEELNIVRLILLLTLTIILLQFSIRKFDEIIKFTNLLADYFFSMTELDKLLTEIFKSSKDLTQLYFWKASIKNVILFSAGAVSGVYFFLLAIYRWVLLSIYYLILPFCISISLLPTFGFNFIVSKFITVFQVASWVIFHSILNAIYLRLFESALVIDLDLSQLYNLIFLLSLSFVYRATIITIPSLASNIFGGSNHSSGMYVSTLMAHASGMFQDGKSLASNLNKVKNVGMAGAKESPDLLAKTLGVPSMTPKNYASLLKGEVMNYGKNALSKTNSFKNNAIKFGKNTLSKSSKSNLNNESNGSESNEAPLSKYGGE